MKKLFTTSLLFLTGAILSFSQNPVSIPVAQYDSLKRNGLLDMSVQYKIVIPYKENTEKPKPPVSTTGGQAKTNNVYCFIPPDPQTYSTPPSFINLDDGGAGPFALPFTFCFYGDNFNSFYINTNGNITFNGIFGTYTPVGFPNASTQPMIAPFWADVDFGGTNPGVLYYQINPTNAIITWQGVGYFNEQNDKRNTFQVIITDGLDPILPPGNNVGFRYQDMQWTTGAASCGTGTPSPCNYNGQTYTCGGNGGFCGAPAVVGANRNNGVDYVQFGQFDHPLIDFNGPFANSGVDWLDFQTFNFSTCNVQNNSNVPPVIQAANICGDTLSVCVGDTLVYDVAFFSPEPGQTTTVDILPVTGSGFSFLSNTPGNTAFTQVQFVASSANIGVNAVQYVATDNGVPAANTSFYLVFKVVDLNLNPVITGNSTVCSGQTTTLSVIGGPYDAYQWLPAGQTLNSITVGPGTYVVKVDSGGCSKNSQPFTVSLSNPQFTVNGNNPFCQGDSIQLSITPTNFTNYNWSNGNNTSSIYVNSGGTLNITVTDLAGCQATQTIQVTMNQASVTIDGPSETCEGIPAVLTANGPGINTYQWSNNQSTQTINYNGGTITVTVITTQGCTATASKTVVQNPKPVADFGPKTVCNGTVWQVNDQSTVAGGSITNWNYDFGNGNTSNQNNPTLPINTSSNLNVTLVVTTDKGCLDTIVASVTVHEKPNVSFTATPICYSLISLVNSSTPGSGLLTNTKWYFGDGNDSTNVLSFNYNYAAPGTYDIKLVVTNSNGCKDSLTQSIVANKTLDFNSVVPNILTPNGDGINDIFGFEPDFDLCFKYTFEIYNRWGSKVFSTNSSKEVWNPAKLSSGVYFWTLVAEDGTKKNGSITLAFNK
jgi:gliding motility-associated-like protein